MYQPVLREVVTELERDAGIDSGTYSVLAYLDRADGAMRMSELQALMRVRYSQPGLSRLVQRMEGDELVERVDAPDDRRATTVRLTRSGRARTRARHAPCTTGPSNTTSARSSGLPTHALTRLLRRVADARTGD